MPGHTVDGQDVAAVHEIVSTALARARDGDGPTLIEAKTYRLRGHSRTDPGTYRPRQEVSDWTARDPIRLLEAALIAEAVLDEDEVRAMHERVQAEVDASAERATEAASPTLEEIKSYVYSH